MKILIVGCGYTGIALGKQLTEHGHVVTGVRRSSDGLKMIRQEGIEAVKADVTERSSLHRLPDATAVIYMVSAGRGGDGTARDVYVTGLRNTVEEFGNRLEPPDRLFYTSSTGVYGNHGGDWVTESTLIEPISARQEILREAEGIALNHSAINQIDGTVLRLGGIYGPDRIRIERYLEGPVTEGVLNLIHRTDAAGAIRFLLEKNLARNAVVNLVDNEPVSKWEFADWLAAEFNRDPPPKQRLAERLTDPGLTPARRERLSQQKRCSNKKLTRLGYTFDYPSYQDGYRSIIENEGWETSYHSG